MTDVKRRHHLMSMDCEEIRSPLQMQERDTGETGGTSCPDSTARRSEDRVRNLWPSKVKDRKPCERDLFFLQHVLQTVGILIVRHALGFQRCPLRGSVRTPSEVSWGRCRWWTGVITIPEVRLTVSTRVAEVLGLYPHTDEFNFREIHSTPNRYWNVLHN